MKWFFSRRMVKNAFPIAFFILFYSALTGVIVPLALLPHFVAYVFFGLFEGNQRFIAAQLPFLLFTITPILGLIGIYLLVRYVQERSVFFLGTLFLTYLAHSLYFGRRFDVLIGAMSQRYQVILLALMVIYFFLIAWVLTRWWQRIVIEHHTLQSLALVLPILAALGLFFQESSNLLLGSYGTIYNVFVQWGGMLLERYQINIYYLDYNGFVMVLLIAVMVTVSTLIERLLTLGEQYSSTLGRGRKA